MLWRRENDRAVRDYGKGPPKTIVVGSANS